MKDGLERCACKGQVIRREWVRALMTNDQRHVWPRDPACQALQGSRWHCWGCRGSASNVSLLVTKGELGRRGDICGIEGVLTPRRGHVGNCTRRDGGSNDTASGLWTEVRMRLGREQSFCAGIDNAAHAVLCSREYDWRKEFGDGGVASSERACLVVFVMVVAAGEMLRLQAVSWQRSGNSTARCHRPLLLEDCTVPNIGTFLIL